MEQGHRQEFLLCTLLKGLVKAQTYHTDPLKEETNPTQPCPHFSSQQLWSLTTCTKRHSLNTHTQLEEPVRDEVCVNVHRH